MAYRLKKALLLYGCQGRIQSELYQKQLSPGHFFTHPDPRCMYAYPPKPGFPSKRPRKKQEQHCIIPGIYYLNCCVWVFLMQARVHTYLTQFSKYLRPIYTSRAGTIPPPPSLLQRVPSLLSRHGFGVFYHTLVDSRLVLHISDGPQSIPYKNKNTIQL